MDLCHSGVQYCSSLTVFKFQPLNCYLNNPTIYSQLVSFSPFVSFCLQLCECSLKNVALHNRHNLCTPPPCLTSGQSLPYLFAHSVCACICVYLSSDFCNPCFSSVSSSSGAVRIHSPHFFPSTLLSLSLLSLFLTP